MVEDDLPIIDLVLADINAVVPNFSSLVASYRLLVGSAEEIKRTPGVPAEIFQRSVLRYDRAGTLIDILLELLCCKIAFASNFLGTVCAPIDLPRYFVNDSEADYTLQHTAEQVLLIELLRLILSCICEQTPCFGPPPPGIGCPPVPPLCCPDLPAAKPPHIIIPGAAEIDKDSDDLINEIAPEILNNLSNIVNPTNPPTTPITPIGSSTSSGQVTSSRHAASPSRRKHYEKGTILRKSNT